MESIAMTRFQHGYAWKWYFKNKQHRIINNDKFLSNHPQTIDGCDDLDINQSEYN